jgi:hypothetical protein
MDARVRKIWLLWWTGWDHAPSLIKECAASWIETNPTWNVNLLDGTTVDNSINISLPAAQWEWLKQNRQAAASDVARLALMAQRGGVYADASEMCFQPCDAWVLRLLQRSNGFVGSREWDAKGHRLLEASNWMAAAAPGHPTALAWLEFALAYWRQRLWGPPCEARRDAPRGCTFHYFWMDDLFGQIWRESATVRGLHAGNGFMHPHQSPLYFRGGAGRMWQSRTAETSRRFGTGEQEPPYYVKLTHKWMAPSARACLVAIERRDPRAPSPLRVRPASPLAAAAAAACEELNRTNLGFALLASAAGRLPSPQQRHPMLANAINATSGAPSPRLCFGAACVCHPHACARSSNCSNPVHCIDAASSAAAWARVRIEDAARRFWRRLGRPGGSWRRFVARSFPADDGVPLRCELRDARRGAGGATASWALACSAGGSETK